MKSPFKIGCAQINPVVADVDGNIKKIIDAISHAKKMGAGCVVFPEMSVIGYPPMDILDHAFLIDQNIEALNLIAKETTGIAAIVGYVDKTEYQSPGLLNSAAFIHDGKIISRHHKSLLPTYDVFDEQRYFSPARNRRIVELNGLKMGISICEDIWNRVDDSVSGNGYIEGRRYEIDPIDELVSMGAQVIINLSASPFVAGKNEIKRKHISSIARRHNVPIVYVNQVGGNDSLVFDGNSFVMNPAGAIVAKAASFNEEIVVADIFSQDELSIPDEGIDAIEQALVLGVRDYCGKCGFKSAVLGLSGGIDSAVTAVIAAKALGRENVLGVTMPSVYSSQGSVDHSAELSKNLGIRMETIPIRGLFDQYLSDLSPVFGDLPRDVTEENLQARIRGTILMALSNKYGHILLTTGNKSELAMGYCTLYGDMNGGLAVISDLPKVMVYALANHLNRDGVVIPQEIIDKAPSAELRENQKDQDTLPPYEILDGILELYVESSKSREEIIAAGYEHTVVDFVLRCVDRNEYKRRQAAPGIKVTSKAFGIGRRFPMAMRFKH